VTTPDSSLRGVCVGPEGDLWFTANAVNKIGRMRPDGTMVGEYPIPTPGSGARCIGLHSNGRMYVTLFDAGMIAEVIPDGSTPG
jgi:virginiamycin B lyase